MKLLYEKYYKILQRGFTDAEFQNACEEVAGTSLNGVFDYVYTAKEVDYNRYLLYGGLALTENKDAATGKRSFHIGRIDKPGIEQEEILHSWLYGN